MKSLGKMDGTEKSGKPVGQREGGRDKKKQRKKVTAERRENSHIANKGENKIRIIKRSEGRSDKLQEAGNRLLMSW